MQQLSWKSWPYDGPEPEDGRRYIIARDLSKSVKNATAFIYGIETYRRETFCLHARWGIQDVKRANCDVVAFAEIDWPEWLPEPM